VRTYVRQGEERSQRNTDQELSGDENFLVGRKELHEDDGNDTDKCTKHGPLVADSIDDPTGGAETDELTGFGDLLQDRLTGGTDSVRSRQSLLIHDSLDIVFAIGQLGTELSNELGESKQVSDQTIIVRFHDNSEGHKS